MKRPWTRRDWLQWVAICVPLWFLAWLFPGSNSDLGTLIASTIISALAALPVFYKHHRQARA